MYVPHDDFSTPTNVDIKILRYMDLPKLVSLLRTSQLYFTRIDQFDDHYEGKPGLGNLTDYVERLAERVALDSPETDLEIVKQRARGSTITMSRLVRSETFANCWHMNEHESMALWTQYGAEGIAIQSTFRRLRDSFDATIPEEVHIGEVSYVDYQSATIPEGWIWSYAKYKRLSFAHERELRALIHRFVPRHQVAPHRVRLDFSAQPKSLTHAVDLSTLIEHIYVAPVVPHWIRDEVAAIADKFGFPIGQVVRSDLNDPYLF